jgi:hypothetical protein
MHAVPEAGCAIFAFSVIPNVKIWRVVEPALESKNLNEVRKVHRSANNPKQGSTLNPASLFRIA